MARASPPPAPPWAPAGLRWWGRDVAPARARCSALHCGQPVEHVTSAGGDRPLDTAHRLVGLDEVRVVQQRQRTAIAWRGRSIVASIQLRIRRRKAAGVEGGIRVPLIVRWPKRIRPAVVEMPMIYTDLPVTLAELAGAKLPGDIDGISLAPLLLAKGELPERAFYWHFPHYTNQGGRPGGAIREGDW